MNVCQIYKLEILKFMFKYKNKTLPNCLKTTLYLHQKLNYPTRFACDDNWAAAFQQNSQLQNVRFNIMVIKME